MKGDGKLLELDIVEVTGAKGAMGATCLYGGFVVFNVVNIVVVVVGSVVVDGDHVCAQGIVVGQGGLVELNVISFSGVLVTVIKVVVLFVVVVNVS